MTRYQIQKLTRRMSPEQARYWRAVLGLTSRMLGITQILPGWWIVRSTMSGAVQVYEVHRVEYANGSEQWTCTCPDHEKGHTCKHIWAVRIVTGFAPDVSNAAVMGFAA